MIEIEVSRRTSLFLVVGLLVGLLALATLSQGLLAGAPEIPPASAAPLESDAVLAATLPHPEGGREDAPANTAGSLDARSPSTSPLQIVTPGQDTSLVASPPAPSEDASAATTQVEGVVTARALHVRAGPGTDHASLTTLAQGDPVRVQGQSEAGSWLQVILADGQVGWVSAAYVTLATDQPMPALPAVGGAP